MPSEGLSASRCFLPISSCDGTCTTVGSYLSWRPLADTYHQQRAVQGILLSAPASPDDRRLTLVCSRGQYRGGDSQLTV